MPPIPAAASDRPRPVASVLATVSDTALRLMIEGACRQVGIPVVAVQHIADVERWPVDQIVVTDAEHLTPWWRAVGAVKVIVLAANLAEAMTGLRNGATAWIQIPMTRATMVGVLVAAGARTSVSGELREARIEEFGSPSLPK